MAIAATAAATQGPATAFGRSTLASSFDTFLKLLTTQMKNQDPLAPLDSNEFTAQLVQMTGVEQQLLTNDLLQKLVGNTANGVSTAVSLIGKDVRAVTDEARLASGEARWTYRLDEAAADLKVEVLDSSGRLVRAAAPTDRKAGDHEFVWDGKDQTGARLPDGTYTLRVTARDAAGAELGSTTYQQGIVTAVEQQNGQTLITVNGAKVTWEAVTSIALAPTQNDNDDTENDTATDGETPPAGDA